MLEKKLGKYVGGRENFTKKNWKKLQEEYNRNYVKEFDEGI
jgi:hypothetical protein